MKKFTGCLWVLLILIFISLTGEAYSEILFEDNFDNQEDWTCPQINEHAADIADVEQWYAIDDVVVSTEYIEPDYIIGDKSIIIDHTCTDLASVPESAITKAKESLHIAYGHTSHGSQLTEGMEGLMAFKPGYDTLYAINRSENSDLSDGALHLHDTYNTGQAGGLESDLGSGGSTLFADRTRTYLATHPATNVIMWSWCGGVSYTNEAGINAYLQAMTQLETDYPNVKFVYMTGHLDGTGLTGRLHLNNEIIREYCRTNNKILFDFEDIESYDPDGNYYGDRFVTDACNYDANGDGQTDETNDSVAMPLNGDRNWAIEWQDAHPDDWFPENPSYPTSKPSHTQHLNGNLKAYASWWMFARIAGWLEFTEPATEAPSVPVNLNMTVESSDEITIRWNHISTETNYEEGFTLERRISGGAFATVATIPADIFYYSDTGLDGKIQYLYRIKAFNAIGESGYSATVSATTPDPALTPVEVKVISIGDDWHYFKGTEAPPVDWRLMSFNDQGWLEGPTGIGYGDSDDATVLTDMSGNYQSVYMRKKFINNMSGISALSLSVNYDDGFIAYINGTEVARSSSVTGNPAYNEGCGGHEAGSPVVYNLDQHISLLAESENILTIHGINGDIYSSDFSMIPELSVIGIENADNYSLVDLMLALQVSAGMTPVTPVDPEMDINGDGVIGIADAIYILQKVAGQ